MKVILYEPETAGNIGAIARLMMNFDFKDLILINPQCDHLSKESQDRAKHSSHILKSAKILNDIPRDLLLVATTARIDTDRNVVRMPISSKDLGTALKNVNTSNIGILFGPEGHGLSNELINKCDFVINIPGSNKNPVLNLSHAVGIVLYEIFSEKATEHSMSNIQPMSKAQKEQLDKMLEESFQTLAFRFENKRETQRKVWKRVLGRAFITKRECASLMGFLRKVIDGKVIEKKK